MPIDEEARRINDVLRYTALVEGDRYMDAYRSARAALESAGYRFVRAGNAWAEPERFGGAYRGINSTFRTSDGLEFELQFHTPESHEMKEDLHGMYEEVRAEGTPPERKAERTEEMRRRWSTVPVPPGADARDRPPDGGRRGRGRR